jgi:hypothetical protein
MQDRTPEFSQEIGHLSDHELEAVCGGDQVAHLPQSIHMDYGKLSINENPTRLA